MGHGSTTASRDRQGMMARERRYSRAGIVSPTTNPTVGNSPCGGGNPGTVISRCSIPFTFLRSTGIPTSVLSPSLYAGFVGDSLNRNMFVSLFCTLKRVSSEVKKWRPAGADRGFTFLNYNLTIAYHRTNLLARYGRWTANANGGVLESLGFKEGFRLDVDVPEGTWAGAPAFHDILIFNTGHWWWAPSKFDPVKSPVLFFKKHHPVIPPIPRDVGLDMVLKHMKNLRPGAIKFFRTQSPRHFEGGDGTKVVLVNGYSLCRQSRLKDFSLSRIMEQMWRHA
ncbi:hypothetical protein I3760_10G134000 [Carya illinoinensis]|nr:hypothetical protein I3760_10G134000 [Carya illinoinensis]